MLEQTLMALLGGAAGQYGAAPDRAEEAPLLKHIAEMMNLNVNLRGHH